MSGSRCGLAALPSGKGGLEKLALLFDAPLHPGQAFAERLLFDLKRATDVDQHIQFKEKFGFPFGCHLATPQHARITV